MKPRRRDALTITKIALASCGRWSGAFVAARRLTFRSVRILFYHGCGVGDETKFEPDLFMHADCLASRLDTIRRHGYHVISLDAAVRDLLRGHVEPDSVVITIDDGWYGTYRYAAPLLAEFDFPATVYVATRYVQSQVPVMDVTTRYILWSARTDRVETTGVAPSIAGAYRLTDPAARHACWLQVTEALRPADPQAQSQALARLANRCKVDWDEIVASRRFHLMTEGEIAELRHSRVSVQLHTHSHVFPAGDHEAACAEIKANRAVLSRLVDAPLNHFCYPSGRYATVHRQWLREEGVDSATTTRPGLATASSDPYFLPRIGDSGHLPMQIFLSELSGYAELLRLARNRVVGAPHAA